MGVVHGTRVAVLLSHATARHEINHDVPVVLVADVGREATLRSHVQPLEIGHHKMRAQLKDQGYSRGCKRLRVVTPGYVDACVETMTVSSVYRCPMFHANPSS